jgi:hypothetical protein
MSGSRKPPVAINSDDNEDNQIYISKNVQRSHSITDTHHTQHSEEDDDDDDSPNEDEHSDDANEEGTDDAADLRELDDEALASALAFEVTVFFSQRLDLNHLIDISVACPFKLVFKAAWQQAIRQ